MLNSTDRAHPVQSSQPIDPSRPVYVILIRRHSGHVEQTHPHPDFATAQAFAKMYAELPDVASVDIECRPLGEVA